MQTASPDLEKPYIDQCEREERYEAAIEDEREDIWLGLRDEKKATAFALAHVADPDDVLKRMIQEMAGYIDSHEWLGVLIAKLAQEMDWRRNIARGKTGRSSPLKSLAKDLEESFALVDEVIGEVAATQAADREE